MYTIISLGRSLAYTVALFKKKKKKSLENIQGINYICSHS